MVVFKPEKPVITGLREKARILDAGMGPITRKEILAALIVFGCILVMSLRSFIPALKPIDKTALILISTILFFITGIMDLEDLEAIPWNIILLFSGAMSIGFCLWETGAAKWLAVNWLVMFQKANWFVFVLSIAFFVLVMTNFIMNVAAIAISLPVALVIAPYLGVAPQVILFASLVTAGMPFMLLVGAAPNAIAYDSKQFTAGEFFLYGIPASLVLMVVVAFAAYVLWPIMGMPVTVAPVP
jgi:sodium-dependent dicarboxylate transporter 2/3/5